MLGDGNPNSGTKGGYFRYQYGVLTLLEQIRTAIAGLPGVDYELIYTSYKAKAAVGGCYSINDFIQRIDIVNAATGAVTSTVWFNETTGTALSGACVPVPIANLDPYIPPSNVNSNIVQWLGSVAPTVGQKIMADSLPVVISSNQSSIPISNAFLDAAISTLATEATLLAINAKLNSLGQTTMAGSMPVTMASNQTDIKVAQGNPATFAGRWPVLIVDGPGLNAASIDGSGNLSTWVYNSGGAAAVNIQDGGNSITIDSAVLDVLLSSRASETTLATILTTAAFQARINTLGQKTMANSTPVVLSSDQSTIPVTATPITSTTGTKSSVAGATEDTLLLASNTSRKGATIYNDSTALLYLSLSTVAASTSSFTVRMAANSYYEVPYSYTGQIRGIWSLAIGNARVTELT